MKRVTIDLEHVKFSKTQIENKIVNNSHTNVKKIKLKKLKVMFVNKWTNSTRSVRKEHNYVKLKQGRNEFIPNRPSVSSLSVPHAPPDQLATVPTNAKVSIKGLSKTRVFMKMYGDGGSKNSGLLNKCLTEQNEELFQKVVQDLVGKVRPVN